MQVQFASQWSGALEIRRRGFRDHRGSTSPGLTQLTVTEQQPDVTFEQAGPNCTEESYINWRWRYETVLSVICPVERARCELNQF